MMSQECSVHEIDQPLAEQADQSGASDNIETNV